MWHGGISACTYLCVMPVLSFLYSYYKQLNIKIMDKIFIHSDVQNLRFFKDKNGIPLSGDRAVSYAMQGADIVGVFYTDRQAQQFYESKRYEENLHVIGFFDKSCWEKVHGRFLA